MKVLITGGTGFVGRNLGEFLLNGGFEVEALSLRNIGWQNNVFNAKAIIHLAGKAHDTANSSNPENYFLVNRDLTIQVFEKFLNSEVEDFFYFSSVKAVADSFEGILTEDYQGNPLTPYGKSKFEAEQYLMSKELPKGKRLFIIRPCMIHGPGNKGNLNLLYTLVKKGLPWPLGAFDNRRSFLNIINLNFLILSMLEKKDLKSGIFNFADDRAISTNELISIISTVLNKKISILNLNRKLVEKIVKISDFFNLPINSERLKKLTESYVVSNSKIKNELGINELPVSVENGLIKTIQSFYIK